MGCKQANALPDYEVKLRLKCIILVIRAEPLSQSDGCLDWFA